MRRLSTAVLFAVLLSVVALAQKPTAPTETHVKAGLSSYTCDQTFSSASGLATAIGNASNGSTICLNSGSYGQVDIFDKGRSGYVTVRPSPGATVSIFPRIGNTDFVKFTGQGATLTLNSALINSCSLNVQLSYLTVAANGGGVAVDASSCPATTHNYLFEHILFDDVGQSNNEGRLGLRSANGAIVRYNTFSGVGSEASDGVQLTGDAQNVDIGPGNTFSGILEALCGGTHCDSIQLFGTGDGVHIFSNYFENGDTFIMAPDGSNDVVVEDNIFNGTGVSYAFKMQFGSAADLIFRHNTVKDAQLSVDRKTENPTNSSNALIENNIHTGSTSSIDTETSGSSACTSCTIRYNLFSSGGNATGTNSVTGTPDFSGGTTPATWAGWQLDTGSPGKGAGNDAADMGTRYYGP